MKFTFFTRPTKNGTDIYLKKISPFEGLHIRLQTKFDDAQADAYARWFIEHNLSTLIKNFDQKIIYEKQQEKLP